MVVKCIYLHQKNIADNPLKGLPHTDCGLVWLFFILWPGVVLSQQGQPDRSAFLSDKEFIISLCIMAIIAIIIASLIIVSLSEFSLWQACVLF